MKQKLKDIAPIWASMLETDTMVSGKFNLGTINRDIISESHGFTDVLRCEKCNEIGLKIDDASGTWVCSNFDYVTERYTPEREWQMYGRYSKRKLMTSVNEFVEHFNKEHVKTKVKKSKSRQ